MSEGNGNHVTWRELNLLTGTLDERFNSVETHFNTIEADVAEIKWAMNIVMENRKARWIQESRRQWWQTWGPPVLAALVAAAVTLLTVFLK